MSDPLRPSVPLLCKLGSALVHIEELLSPNAAPDYDKPALQGVLDDPEVREWLQAMDKMALLPVKR